MPPPAVKVVLPPLQMAVAPLIVGIGLGVMVTVSVAVPLQVPLVTVTVYVVVVVGDTVIAAVVAPLSQL